jgi:small subunit ribosomal protein S6
MREYETVFITQPNITDADKAKIHDRVSALIERNRGRLFFARNMGKRALAYRIEKQTKGIYTCLDYAAEGTAVRELEHELKLDENVLRFLTIVKNESVDVEARAAEIIARGEDQQLPVEDQDKPFDMTKSFDKSIDDESADDRSSEEA